MAYNECDGRLHRLISACFDYPGSFYEITSRINGDDGRVEIIKAAARYLELGDDGQAAVRETLSERGFKLLRGYRNAVVHARLVDASSSVGRSYESNAKYSDVLLTVEALRWLYDQLNFMIYELYYLEDAIACAMTIRSSVESDGHRVELLRTMREGIAKCQEHQRARLSQPPPPEFPEEADILEWEPHSGVWPGSR